MAFSLQVCVIVSTNNTMHTALDSTACHLLLQLNALHSIIG